jgi:PAS domain S-box-containing protein
MERNLVEPGQVIAWIVIIGLLYMLSLSHYLFFYILVKLFSILIAFIVFVIIWKSKTLLLNRYLLLIGVSYFFVGSVDLLHTLAFKGMGVFPELDANPGTQLWIIARYMESVSLFIAPLLLMRIDKNENSDSMIFKNAQFARSAFLTYAIITAYLLVSVFHLKNFPDCYIPGSGFTSFSIMSKYIIFLMLSCSLILLYRVRDRFDSHVLKLLAVSIILTIFGGLFFTFCTHLEEFFTVVGHFFKILAIYFIYKAIVETGFEEPSRLLFMELKQREETLQQEASFLTNEQALIYSVLGVKQSINQKKAVPEDSHYEEEDYRSFMQNFYGILFQLDKDLLPVLIEGSIEEMTGYEKQDFLSGKVKWAELVIPECIPISPKRIIKSKNSSTKKTTEKEYRIRRKDGKIRWVREILRPLPKDSGDSGKFQGSVHDISERKMIEETVRKREEARIKEIHHRIKNNLQVISSLLDLQAEKFSGLSACDTSKVMEAFRESQNRVISMALIHEELYRSKGMATLDFAGYLHKLTADLLNSYALKTDIGLKLNLEQVYLGMDTSIPLGIIVNELVTNSLKYAFKPGMEGEISISLCNIKDSDEVRENSADSGTNQEFENEKCFQHMLIVADNGSGIPSEFDIENTDSLGLQLINVLVDQIEGHLEIKVDTGTEFRISFNNM